MILDNKIYKYCSYKNGELIVSGQLLIFTTKFHIKNSIY